MSQFFKKLIDDDLFTQAAALAFFALISLPPLASLTISALSFLHLSLPDQLLLQTNFIFNESSREFINSIILKSQKLSENEVRLGGGLGVVTFLVSSSLIFVQLQATFNRIFGSHQSSSSVKYYLHERLFSFILVFFFIILCIFTLAISTLLSVIINEQQQLNFAILGLVISSLLYLLTFSLGFRWIPNCPVGWKACVVGALCTSFLMLGAKYALDSYLIQNPSLSLYGSARAMMLFLLWIYYATLVVFLGAELAWLYEKSYKPKVRSL